MRAVIVPEYAPLVKHLVFRVFFPSAQTQERPTENYADPQYADKMLLWRTARAANKIQRDLEKHNRQLFEWMFDLLDTQPEWGPFHASLMNVWPFDAPYTHSGDDEEIVMRACHQTYHLSKHIYGIAKIAHTRELGKLSPTQVWDALIENDEFVYAINDLFRVLGITRSWILSP